MNMQKLIGLLETMFGDMDMDDIDISKLEAETTQNLHKEAETAEAASIATETGAIPKDKIMRVYVNSLPVPPEFRIPPQSLPETENVKERSVKNPAKKVMRFYYICHLYPHSLQNKASMMTHTQRCLNIKLVCAICSKAYDSSKYIKNILMMHTTVNAPERLPRCLLPNYFFKYMVQSILPHSSY